VLPSLQAEAAKCMDEAIGCQIAVRTTIAKPINEKKLRIVGSQNLGTLS
jgi:hypothetical protein